MLWNCKSTYVIDTEEELVETLEDIKSDIDTSNENFEEIATLMNEVIKKN